jgi:adenosylcobalamin-dependent ribonucleoside-triphosphate reductase
MFELMWDFKFLPPGRGLWAMGTKHVADKGGAALNNCGFVSTKDIATDPATPFEFIMDMSMVGVGVGFDTRGANTLEIKKPVGTYESVISDDREGWVASLKQLISAYATGGPLPIFVYDLIRQEGAPIKGFGGVASGPEPLKDMHECILEILESRVGDFLTSTDIVDIGNLIGRCVVAGNVRRSAEIVFGSPDDMEYALLKQDKEKADHHRWASNNSIFAEVGMDYKFHAAQTAKNGEPGYMWLDNARAFGRMIDPPNHADAAAMGGNPCLEQTLHPFELCTLVETFPSRHKNLAEYLITLKVAYLYAKTITLLPTHWPQTNAVMTKNRRIGLSQSGITKAFAKFGRRIMTQWCDKGYEWIESLDKTYSDWLGVPRSIKKTSVKPSGTVSLLPGEPPGIHYPHSEYYIRRIRISAGSPLVTNLREAGYRIEPCVGQEESTVVVEFPVREENFEKCKSDATIWEQVANAVMYQKFWADNQLSITVTFKKEEERDIQSVLEHFEDQLKGISFLPLSEHGYEQAPYEEITAKEFDEMTRDLQEVKFTDLGESLMPKFCDGDSCEVPQPVDTNDKSTTEQRV